jgi:hypothetical protein
MTNQEPVVWLTFFTLAAGIVVAGAALLYFLRSRHNRFLAERTLVGDGGHHAGSAPDGVLPELIGILAIALVAMGLLLLGYAGR